MLGNPYVLLGIGVAWLLSIFVAFGYGHHYATLQQKASTLEETKHVIVEQHEQEQVTQDVSQKAATQDVQIQVVTKEIVKWRTRYVTQKADAACVVPRGFVRMHDDAAVGVPSVPDPAGQPDDGPSGIALSDAGAAIADNYGTCRQVRQDFMSLQDWVRRQAAVR